MVLLAMALPVRFRILLLCLFHVASHGLPAPPPDSYRAACTQPQTCGGVPINYPFYLSNTAEYYCGYPGLGINCQDDGEMRTPTLRLGDENYTVKSIQQANSTINLVESDALSNGDCPRVLHNVSLGNGWLRFTNSRDTLTFFFNCSIPSDPPPGQIKCFPSGLGQAAFVLPTALVSPDSVLAKMCPDIVVVPVFRDRLTGLLVPDLAKPDGYGGLLKQGFELAWNRASEGTPCYQCEQSQGQCGYNQTGGFLGCFCSDGRMIPQGQTQVCPPAGYGNEKPRKKTAVIIGVSIGGGVLLLCLALVSIWYSRKRRQQKVNSSSKLLSYTNSGGQPWSRGGGNMESGSVRDLQAPIFTYEELEEATDGFKDTRELGDGGFGTVYKGQLRDGRVVAVKRLYNNSYRRVEQFVNEAAILSRLRHPNLVMFYGCTSSRSRELLLVYEFVPNGTVADHLHGPRAPERALTWPLRLNIAIESAAALAYLHAIEPPIVHRDVKTNNILLDADFHVKVADFGLSRLFPLDVTHVSTAPQGTPGYVDPEYHQCYQLTDKSDVYSFGVVLVELISSKPAVDITRQRNEINLAGMAINKIQKCQLDQLVDLELGYSSDPLTKKMMTMVAELAFRCLQHNGEMRPPIKEVLEVLRGIQDGYRTKKDGQEGVLTAPFSPDTVHVKWESTSTTPHTSQ